MRRLNLIQVYECYIQFNIYDTVIILKLHFWRENIQMSSPSKQRCYVRYYITLLNMYYKTTSGLPTFLYGANPHYTAYL